MRRLAHLHDKPRDKQCICGSEQVAAGKRPCPRSTTTSAARVLAAIQEGVRTSAVPRCRCCGERHADPKEK